MKRVRSPALGHKRVAQLLSDANREASLAGRIDVLSRRFIGCPYRANPLGGSPDIAEAFTANLDGFDCVTYVETVLALACAGDVDGFFAWLKKIRYERGRVEWRRRNHYMTAWIRNNVREGIIRPVLPRGLPVVTREKVLNVVPGLAARRIRIRCAPKASMRRLSDHLKTGDLIFFASTRRNLDVFHAGIVARRDASVLLRHASRSRGCVVEEELREFARANRMAGVIVARPREIRRSGGLTAWRSGAARPFRKYEYSISN
jgi:cell wall-associated NlpC family hydrolase